MNRFVSSLATLALLAGFAGTARADDLILYSQNYHLDYRVNGESSPILKFVPNAPSSGYLNSANTSFLLPCNVENLGGQVQVFNNAPGGALYPKVVSALYRADGTVITSTGYSHTHSFNSLDLWMPQVAVGSYGLAGFTLVSTVNTFRDWLYQPGDLPANTPVRLQMTVFGYSDSQYSVSVADPNSANNQLNVWLMRVCSN